MKKYRASFVNAIISTVHDMIVKFVLAMEHATVVSVRANRVGQVNCISFIFDLQCNTSVCLLVDKKLSTTIIFIIERFSSIFRPIDNF